MPEICETCGKAITNYWGYLSDFYPQFYPPRDRSNDQVLYGITTKENGKDIHHYFCCPEHLMGGVNWLAKLMKSERLEI